MGEAPLILGVSGLRGIVGESLTPEVAARYARSVGAWWAAQDPYEDLYEVLIAHDGRAGHESVYHAAIAGLLASGWGVRPLGKAMTPTVGAAVDRTRNCAGGIVVTASHNPGEWNGLKCISALDSRRSERGHAAAPPADQALEIVRRFEQGDFSRAVPQDYSEGVAPGSVRVACLLDAMSDASSQHAIDVCVGLASAGYQILPGESEKLSSTRVVLDSVNASGAVGATALWRELDISAIQLHGDESGIFPHTPEPTKENLSGEGGLCDAVPGLKADVGFAQDPDADRLAIVDEMGEYIGEEYTLVLAALSLLEARETPSVASGDTSPAGAGEDQERQAVIVTNLSTSRMIDDVAARYGARVERTAVGEANVVERMKALRQQGEDVVLGGEGNGGVIWPEVVYVRDSLGAMALTLALMARKGMKVSELVSWIDSMAGDRGDGYVILKRKVDIPSKDAAAPAVEAVRRGCEGESGAVIDLQDGVRVDWPGERAWVHVRASNTEPIMRLICEAPSEGAAEALLGRIEGMIAAG